MDTEQLDILVVEDDAAHAEAIRRAFSANGVKVALTLVATLREFRDRAARNPPDLAIMDLNLPDGRAVEVMTSPPENGAFPILLMTSYGNERVAVEAIKSGAIDYIVKSPETFAGMPRTVERALREWRLLVDRKRAEQEIRESEARFHTLSNQFNALLDSLPDRIILHGPGQRVIWANRAATAEMTADEIKADESHCYTVWHKQKVPCDSCPVMKSLQSGEAGIAFVTTVEGKIWELRSIPVKENGLVVSVIEIARDITEHRKLEDQLRQAQKMDAVGRLAGGVAHDFNNMLNVMMGYSELALKRVESDKKTSSYLHGVLDAGRRSADLTRQLLAFSRKQVVEPRILDINQRIADQMNLLGKLIGEDIRVSFVPGFDVGQIMMDPSQVDQILANLMVNARDAIDGTGDITITTSNIALDDAYCRNHPGVLPGEYVRLAVSDNGSGMDAATLEQIFEPFYTTKDKGKGTGLGLATIYGIVKQNNGEIHASSAQGSGTTFVIHLPRLSIVQDNAPAEPGGGIKRGSETVLLVEDDESNLEITRLLLEESGYTVISTTSPFDACTLFEQRSDEIALLLSDVIMPELNGKQLYERISAVRPGLKVLFMSGYTDDVISHRGILSEGTNFIHKPFTITKLAEKVRVVLDEQ
ncbi:MAG TPA: hybrid sensor histidine kinase/response regulator [Geobacter sp.]|nr:hybrid sensor histidine kinase/response regulator [Geobacter sp.]HCE68965.1 hybrid sensor histidine kinase/response regulator [Geobacter sp.]